MSSPGSGPGGRRAVVIGSGVGGLATAARLCAAGHDVTVIEQASRVGGKLGLHQQDGYTFDTGPSLVTLPWILSETLQAIGAPPLPLRRLDPIAAYRFADGTWFDADADEEAFRRGLDRTFGIGASAQWGALMARAARVWDASERPILRSPLRGPRDLLPLMARPRSLHAVAPHRTLRGLGREYLSDPRLRMVLDRYATYSGSDPRRAPAALVSVPYAERHWGGWYVDGGLRRIADVLLERLVELGGRVMLDTQVTRITLTGGRADGVVVDGGRHIPADLVVANADASTVADELLPTTHRKPLQRRLRFAPRSSAGHVLLLGVRTADLSGRAAQMAHHTVLFPADYDAEFDGLFGTPPRYVDDPTIYVSVPADPAVAPDGHQAWFVLVNAPRADQVARPPVGYAEHILDRLAQRGIDVRPGLELQVERTPADLERDTATPGGAIYGTSSNGPLAAFLRPPNLTGIDGLYLVGGSSHPGGGLPLVLLSAEIVAGQIAGATG